MASAFEKDEHQQPLTTQGDSGEKEEQLSGTTNLSEDQLKKERDPAEDNPDRIENPDDLHEIKVDDDLNEPDTEKLQPSKDKDVDSLDANLYGELDEDAP